MKERWRTGMRGALIVALVVTAFHAAGGLEWAERHLMDLRFPLAARPATGKVIVVAIDPRSLSSLDVWPWPRGYHATVLENLIAAGARRVAFDIDFSSRSSQEEDAAFAEVLAAVGDRVLLPVFHQWQAADDGGGRLVSTRPLETFSPPASLAAINIEPERDGLVRRYGSPRWPSAEAVPPLALAMARPGVVTRQPFHLDFGIDPASIPVLSYLDILTERFDRSLVAGRDVIVGATAVELGDQSPVPRHAAVPGPILQAIAYESLVSGRTLSRPPAAAVATVLVLLALTVGAAIQRASWRHGMAIAAGTALSAFAVSVAAQRMAPVILDIAPVAAAMVGWYGLALVRRLDHLDMRLWLASLRARHTELRMRHVVENCGEAIVTLDASGIVQTFNRAAELLFGVPAEAALARPFRSFLGGAPLPDAGCGRRAEIEVAGADGGKRTLDVAVSDPGLDGKPLQVVFLRDVTQSRVQRAALEHQATHDALTDLPNRTLLLHRMNECLPEAARVGRRAALLMLDLDGFKEINDTLGHSTGDILLREIAARLRQSMRSSSTVARLGGDEFAVLIPDAGVTEAEAACHRLLDALASPFAVQGMALQVEGSIGIAICPDHGTEAGVLLQRADVAMYQAKGRHGTFRIYDAESDLNSLRMLTLKGDLREAIEQGRLELHYQPKVQLATGETVGVEALVRWRHPRHGWLPPQEFVPLAERTGLIRPLTRWVLSEALAQAACWEAQGFRLPVAVNCSARNLLEKDLPEAIVKMLGSPGLKPDRLILEITETAVIDEPGRSLEVLREVAARGIQLSIDDFGTAYSSLDYLRKLPARELKIDRSFVMGLDRDEANTAIVRATISLARDFGLRSVAEGIESASTMDRLRNLGCDQAQGYHFARPMPASRVEDWLRSHLVPAEQGTLPS